MRCLFQRGEIVFQRLGFATFLVEVFAKNLFIKKKNIYER